VHIVITGASAGIGAALARELAQPPARLTLVARRAEALAALADELAVPTHCAVADLTDLDRVTDWIPGAEAAHGPIDVLINNAGVSRAERFAESDTTAGETLLRLNLFAPLRLTRAVLPAMIARRRGMIVDVASSAAFAAYPGTVYYGASKAGYANASEVLRGELRGTGVHVVTVYPGPIATDMSQQMLNALSDGWVKRMVSEASPTGLAARIHRAMDRREPRVIYPAYLAVLRRFPNLTRFFVDRLTPTLKRPAHS